MGHRFSVSTKLVRTHAGLFSPDRRQRRRGLRVGGGKVIVGANGGRPASRSHCHGLLDVERTASVVPRPPLARPCLAVSPLGM
jgi:hypothetical protein